MSRPTAAWCTRSRVAGNQPAGPTDRRYSVTCFQHEEGGSRKGFPLSFSSSLPHAGVDAKTPRRGEKAEARSREQEFTTAANATEIVAPQARACGTHAPLPCISSFLCALRAFAVIVVHHPKPGFLSFDMLPGMIERKIKLSLNRGSCSKAFSKSAIPLR
jgi:hypothetical protein